MAYNNARLIARPDKEWLEPLPVLGQAEADGEDPPEIESQ